MSSPSSNPFVYGLCRIGFLFPVILLLPCHSWIKSRPQPQPPSTPRRGYIFMGHNFPRLCDCNINGKPTTAGFAVVVVPNCERVQGEQQFPHVQRSACARILTEDDERREYGNRAVNRNLFSNAED